MSDETLEKGIAAHRAGRFKEAEGLYTAILNTNPNHPDANHNMGVLAVNVGNPQFAVPYFEKALNQNKSALQYWLSLANAYLKLGRYSSSVKLTRRPDFIELPKQQSMKIEQLISGFVGDLDSYYNDTAHKVAPPARDNKASAELRRAILRAQEGELQEAEELLKEDLKVVPENKLALEGLDFVLAKKQNHHKAFASPTITQLKKVFDLLEDQKFIDVVNEAQSLLLDFPFSEVTHNMYAVGNFRLNNVNIALRHYGISIFIAPKYADARYNLGLLQHSQNRYKPAIAQYEKTVEIDQKHAKAYNNIGSIYKQQADYKRALESYRLALRIEPNWDISNQNFASALQKVNFVRADPEIAGLICQLLKKPGMLRPKDISDQVLQLLWFEPAVIALADETASSERDSEYFNLLQDVAKIDLLVEFMAVCPIGNVPLECIIKNARSYLLQSEHARSSQKFLKFQAALALHCFTNEYILNITPSEKNILQKLTAKIEKLVSSGAHPESSDILCVASYSSLNNFKWATELVHKPDIKDVVLRQIVEPNQELELSKKITTDLAINDQTSLHVREQYEENPYPRWTNLRLAVSPVDIAGLVRATRLKLSDQKILQVREPTVLVAGCGTGQHPLGTSSRLAGSSVTAIDLSLSSLAYAKRKTIEFGIKNIEYMQHDILNVGSLKKDFHIIETSGVLHHMKDPFMGWLALANCLLPGGLMRIGLYSELARQHIAAVREEISISKIGSSPVEMKRFRDHIIKSDNPNHKKLLHSPDFYSLSTFRDLVFHVQEHRFTIRQLKNYIQKTGFTFCGFENNAMNDHFKTQFNEKYSEFDLDNWELYERNNPDAFGGMYQFWCQKNN